MKPGGVHRGLRERFAGNGRGRRDPKSLYKKARAGQLKGFTGIDDPYEAPEKPEIVIETETTKPEDAAKQILAYLEKGGYLAA